MKHRALSPILALFALALAFAPRPAAAELEVSFDYFYDALTPYGHWADVEDYGYCWTPDGVGPDWTPYSEGNWVYTDAGWAWEGDEDFSAIVYHYGRWILVEGEGWFWVPGYEWGAAWVAWRDSDEYVGWAPLPPDAEWQPTVGFGVWVDDVYDIGPRYYSFCHRRDFGEHHLLRYILPRTNNMLIINETLNVTNISYQNSHGWVHCGGPDYERANRYATHAIPSLQLVQRRDYDFETRNRHRDVLPRGVATGESFIVVAPRIHAAQGAKSARPETTKSIPKSLVHKGWTGAGDARERESVRAKIHAETRGLTPKNAPARTITANTLQQVQPKRSTGSTITSETRRSVEEHAEHPPKGVGVPRIRMEDNPPPKLRTSDGGRSGSDQLARERAMREALERDNAAHERTKHVSSENGIRVREAAEPKKSSPQRMSSDDGIRVREITEPKKSSPQHMSSDNGIRVREMTEPKKSSSQHTSSDNGIREREITEPKKSSPQHMSSDKGMRVREVSEPQKSSQHRVDIEKIARQRDAEDAGRKNLQRQQDMQRQQDSQRRQQDMQRQQDSQRRQQDMQRQQDSQRRQQDMQRQQDAQRQKDAFRQQEMQRQRSVPQQKMQDITRGRGGDDGDGKKKKKTN